MNWQRSRWVALVLAGVAAVGATVWMLAAGIDTDTRGGTDAHIYIDPLDPAHSSPDTVAVNAMGLIFSWRPGTDTTSWDALHRATRLLTGPLAAAASAPPSPAPRPIPGWDRWVRDGDTISAAASTAAPAIVDGDIATTTVTVHQQVLHSGGKTTPFSANAYQVLLHRVGDQWLVGKYTLATGGAR